VCGVIVNKGRKAEPLKRTTVGLGRRRETVGQRLSGLVHDNALADERESAVVA